MIVIIMMKITVRGYDGDEDEDNIISGDDNN